MIDKELFGVCAKTVQEKWQMGGLADTIYEDFALAVTEEYEKRRAHPEVVTPSASHNGAMPKPHRAVCSHCYGSFDKEMCDNCDNGSRFYPLCRADGVASA